MLTSCICGNEALNGKMRCARCQRAYEEDLAYAAVEDEGAYYEDDEFIEVGITWVEVDWSRSQIVEDDDDERPSQEPIRQPRVGHVGKTRPSARRKDGRNG